MLIICQDPANVTAFLGALQKIQVEIETTTLPPDKTATDYVNEKVIQAFKEAAQRAVTFRPNQPTRIFSKPT